MSIPYITAEEVEPHLDWLALADALEAGHRGARAEIGDQFLHRGGDTFLSRAAWIEGLGIAVKSVTVLPGNVTRGLPSIHGALVLFEDASGRVEAVIDSALVTRWKTAADSLLGARLLARQTSERLLIVGAGAVAASLIEAYRALFPQIHIEIWNRTSARAAALAEAAGVNVAADLPLAVAAADIVACATMSKVPVLKGDWVGPGTHIDLIGAFTPEMREADDDCLSRARIFVDSRETTLAHIGELRIPLEAGAIAPTDVLADLYDLCAGAPGRLGSGDVTLFKNGGGAHLDLMTGRVILDTWRRLAG